MNTFGIGIDIQDSQKFSETEDRPNQTFLDKIFTKKELAYCFGKKEPAQHLGVRFCCKEAVIKALNSLDEFNIHCKGVEITNNESGVPFAHLPEQLASKYVTQVSLTHAAGMCVAVAVVVRKD